MECNYYQIPKIARFLTPSEWVLFTIMFDEWKMMKNENDWYFRSHTQLCKDTGLSEKTLKRAIKKLVEKGVIFTTYYNDGFKNAQYNKANEYKINMKTVNELSKKGVKMNTYSQKEGGQNDHQKGVKITGEGGQNDLPSKEERTNNKKTKEKENVNELERNLNVCRYGNNDEEVEEAFKAVCMLVETETYRNSYEKVCSNLKEYRNENPILHKVLRGYE